MKKIIIGKREKAKEINPNTTVIFKVKDDDYFEIKHVGWSEEVIEIRHCDRSILIQPNSSNLIFVGREKS